MKLVLCIAGSGVRKVPGLLSSFHGNRSRFNFNRVELLQTQVLRSNLVLRTPAGGEGRGGPTSKGPALSGPQELPWVRETCEGLLEERLGLTE